MSRKNIDAIIEGINESRSSDLAKFKGFPKKFEDISNGTWLVIEDIQDEFKRIVDNIEDIDEEDLEIDGVAKHMKKCEDLLDKCSDALENLYDLLSDIR